MGWMFPRRAHVYARRMRARPELDGFHLYHPARAHPSPGSRSRFNKKTRIRSLEVRRGVTAACRRV